MVNLEVYNAYANQHKHTLMQSAQVSRDLKYKNDVSRSMNHTSPLNFAWLGKHLLSNFWSGNNKSRDKANPGSQLTT